MFNTETPREGSHSVTPLKMRCPNCNKLYSLDASLLHTSDLSLEFQCISCQTRFAAQGYFAPDSSLQVETFEVVPVSEASKMSASESSDQNLDSLYDVDEVPFDWVPPESELPPPQTRAPAQARAPIERVPKLDDTACPRCSAFNPAEAADCISCGVVIAKYKPLPDYGLPGEIRPDGHRKLTELWDEVMKNYGDMALHERFVTACASAEQLAYASQHYARILAVTPTDETARLMRQRIIGLASFHFESAGVEPAWQFRLPRLNDLAIALGSAVTTTGLMLPKMGDVAIFGFILLVLALGLRFFLRPRPRR